MVETAFALVVAAAGWHYLFYSRMAARLAETEGDELNRWRGGLRRIGGAVLFLLAICFFAGFHAVDPDYPTRAFVLIWTAVILLLATLAALGIIDFVLTWKLLRRLRP
jgi:prolipoprotein diacylglyceryltransferase